MNLETLCLGCMDDDSGAPVCPKCGRPADLPAKNSLQLTPRTMLRDQYLIGRALGHGGFGITYLSWDLGLETRLAIKEYMPNGVAGRSSGETKVLAFSDQTKPEFEWGLERFMEEARVLKKFRDHPGIISIDTVFRDNGTAYLVMEYLDGSTFEEFLRRRGGKITFETALRVMLPVIDALSAVHAEGILHRDVSPDNIYLTRNGKVKLIDFGAARNALGQKSRNLSIILKEGYAPEEQYRASGIQGPWTDVYATAATLYHAITGKSPQPALDRQAQDEVLPPSQMGFDMEPRAEAALMRALAVKANDRFQSMEDFKLGLTGTAPVSSEAPVRERQEAAIPTPRPIPREVSPAAPPPAQPVTPVREQPANMRPPISARPVEAPPPPAHMAASPARSRWILPAILGAAALVTIGVVLHKPDSDTNSKGGGKTSVSTGATGSTGARGTTAPSAKTGDNPGADGASGADSASTIPPASGTTGPAGATTSSGGGSTLPAEGASGGSAPSGGGGEGSSGGAPKRSSVANSRKSSARPPSSDGASASGGGSAGTGPLAGLTGSNASADGSNASADGSNASPGGSNTSPGRSNANRGSANRGGPDAQGYDGLLNQAKAAWNQHDYQQAQTLLQQAIRLDPEKPRAYDGLAELQLYQLNDLAGAVKNYQAALAHGGEVTFHVAHDHSGETFATQCRGFLHISPRGVRYVPTDFPAHAFNVARADVREIRKNRMVGILGRRTSSDFHAFHIRLANGQNYNFAPQSRFTDSERDLILAFLGVN
jgi:serine/threonine protein kinase